MPDRTRRSLFGIILLGLALRLATSIYLGEDTLVGPGTADQVSYHNLALRLLSGHGFSFGKPWWPLTQADAPTAHWSYLYTYYLAAVYWLFGPNPLAARLIQSVVVGILQPLLAFLIGRRLGGVTVGLVSTGGTALYAYFIYYSASLMTEAFYISMVLASLWLAIRMADKSSRSRGSSLRLLSIASGLGVALGIAVLFRQVFLLLIPFLLVWVWWAGGKRHLTAVVLPALIVALMVMPFSVFNFARFGRFVLLNTNSGYALFWANHPVYGTQFEPILPVEMGTYQELIPEELHGLDEAALDQELLKRGLGFIAGDPIRYIRLSLSRVPAYFMFWPSAESSAVSNMGRTLSFGLLMPFMVYGLIRSWIDRGRAAIREPIGLLILFVVIYSAIHLLSWSLIRYRLPVDAVLVAFAGYGMVDLAQRIRVIREQASQPA